MTKYALEVTVFLTGAVVMILELVGSRILAPYAGTSLPVWTALIGIIMASLSIGYFLGGKLADQKANLPILARIILLSSIAVFVTNLLRTPLLVVLQHTLGDVRLVAITGSLALFSIPTFLLGMVSPFAVKIQLTTLAKGGSTVGQLSAISTFGSIFGTFIAGFILIAFLGINGILLMLSIVLLLTSLFLNFQTKVLTFLAVITLYSLLPPFLPKNSKDFSLETNYNHVRIFSDIDSLTGLRVLRLNTGEEYDSAMFLDSNELVYPYSKLFNLFTSYQPNPQKVLVIGGAAYSYPKYLLANFPNLSVDVVELDPALTNLAKNYFNLKEDPRLTIYHEDGRTFINYTKSKYDVIFLDAFKAYSPPFHLTTLEFLSKVNTTLASGGVVVSNVISAPEGPKAKFFLAEYSTFTKIFRSTDVFITSPAKDLRSVQNIILIGSNAQTPTTLNPTPYQGIKYETNQIAQTKPLTDDFAPVEYLNANLY